MKNIIKLFFAVLFFVSIFLYSVNSVSASTFVGTTLGSNQGHVSDGYPYGSYIFVPNNGIAGIDVYDISNTASPYLYTNIATSGSYENTNIISYGSYLYIANTGGYIDIIDPNSFSYVGNIGPGSGGYFARSILYGDTLYVGSSTSVDAYLLSTNTYLGSLGTSAFYTSDLIISGNKLYAFRDTGVADVFDITTNSYLTTIGSGISSSYVRSKPYLYGANIYIGGNNGFDVFDTNTDTLITSITTSNNYEATSFVLIGTNLFIPSNNSTIEMIDTTSNTYTSSSLPQAFYSGIYADGSKIFLPGNSGNIDVLDANTFSVVETISTGHVYQYSNVVNAGVLVLPYKDGGIDIIDPVTIPNLISFTSATSDGTYSFGDPVINITANFDIPIDPGSSMIVTTDTGIQVTLDQVSGNSLYGYYTIAGYEATTDLSVNTIDGATINSYSPSYSLPSSPNNLQDSSNIQIQVVSPTITNITSTNTDGLYTSGDSIAVYINFDRNIHPSSTMSVTLDTGYNLNFFYGGSSQLVGVYSIPLGHTTLDLTVSSINSADVSSFNSFSIPSGNNLGDIKDIQIQSSRPACSAFGINYTSRSHLLNGKIYTMASGNNMLRVNNIATGELYGLPFPSGFGNANAFMLVDGNNLYISNNQTLPAKMLVVNTVTDSLNLIVSASPYTYQEGTITNNKIYIPGVGVNVFDLISNTFTGGISMPTARTSNIVAFGQYVYSPDIGTTIRKIDTNTDSIVANISGGSGTYQYSNPFVLGTKIYFPVSGTDIIDVLDTTTDIITPLDTNHIRNGLRALVDGDNAYLPYNGGVDIINVSGSVSTITTGTTFIYANSIPVKVGNKLYISGFNTPSQGISVFDLDTNIFLYNVATPQHFLSNSPVLVGTKLHYLGAGSSGTQTYQILDTVSDTISSLPCGGIDITPPVITNVHLESNNIDPTKAVDGDIIKISYTIDDQPTGGSLIINGSPVVLSGGNCLTSFPFNCYGEFIVSGAQPVSDGIISFSATVEAASGSAIINSTTDGSFVNVDRTVVPPVVPPVVTSGGGGGAVLILTPIPTTSTPTSTNQTTNTNFTPSSNPGKTYISPIDNKEKLCPGFTQYLRKGSSGGEVKLLQAFLNKKLNKTIPLTNYFGNQTESAVREYQLLNKSTVMTPWGLTSPTGWWYQSTRFQANKDITCSEGTVKLDNGLVIKG